MNTDEDYTLKKLNSTVSFIDKIDMSPGFRATAGLQIINLSYMAL